MKRLMLNRWKKWLFGAVMAVSATGCTKQLYMTPETKDLATSIGLPPDLATNPNIVATPDVADHKAPSTVLEANREPRYMTLQEAFALALERGNVGTQQGSNFGNLGAGSGRGNLFQDDLTGNFRPAGGGDDSIRAFALDPAIAAADIEGALSKFDARITTSMSWQKTDQLVANVFNNFNNGDLAAFSSGLFKPLPTGGVAGITFLTNYQKLGAIPAGFAAINPSYQPSLLFQFEQPLLRDNGIDINQLLPAHPGSLTFTTRASGGRTEGILVTRIRAEQARSTFERDVNLMILNVESTYWQLYAFYFAKYAAEQALRQGYITWDQLQQLQTAGLQTKQGVAQARAQLEEFRFNYMTALQNVIETERQLRGLIGMTLEDGKRIVPADAPTLAPYKPDYNSSLVEALNNRPELAVARDELKVQQLNVMLQQNNIRPDLRFFGNYNINANGTRLDGPGPTTTLVNGQFVNNTNNALATLADNKFNNWQFGLRFDMPLGTRDAHAQLKVAQLNLARSHITLKNQERKAESLMGSIYQQLVFQYEQIKLQRARRIALGTQLEGQFERVKIGKDPLIQLLDAQNRFADAIRAEHQAIANYNVAIAGFQYSKGAILAFNNIQIMDGALPPGVAERAADHYGAKSAAITLRERASNTTLPQDMETPAPLPGLVEGGQPLPAALNGMMSTPLVPNLNPNMSPAPMSTTPPAPLPMPSPMPTPAPTPKPAGKEVMRPLNGTPMTTLEPQSLPGVSTIGPSLNPADAIPSVPVSRFRP
ncbi:TolC family protein [Zavarzinella formosa]|uniref:TolC family protein n=1 Tax=Zavarzinella formosa TaxID=360055 RepID=UPI0002F2433D|nr:TolC family protein [Zavarzinella formosa]